VSFLLWLKLIAVSERKRCMCKSSNQRERARNKKFKRAHTAWTNRNPLQRESSTSESFIQSAFDLKKEKTKNLLAQFKWKRKRLKQVRAWERRNSVYLLFFSYASSSFSLVSSVSVSSITLRCFLLLNFDHIHVDFKLVYLLIFFILFLFYWKLFEVTDRWVFQEDEYGVRVRLLEKSVKDETEHRLLHAGESGDNFITSIPFQVCEFFNSSIHDFSVYMMFYDRLVEISIFGWDDCGILRFVLSLKLCNVSVISWFSHLISVNFTLYFDLCSTNTFDRRCVWCPTCVTPTLHWHTWLRSIMWFVFK